MSIGWRPFPAVIYFAVFLAAGFLAAGFFAAGFLAAGFLSADFVAAFEVGFLAVFGALGTVVSTTELSSLANSERTYLSAFQSLIHKCPSIQ